MACFIGLSYGEERMTLFQRHGLFSRLCGHNKDHDNHNHNPHHDQDQENPEDAFGAQTSSFGPCVTPIGAGKCTSSSNTFYNYCRKNGVSLENCQASVSKLQLAVGIDYDSTSNICYALFPGAGLTKADLETACPDADEVTFFYPQVSGFPVDGNSGVDAHECFRCSRS